MEFGEMNLAERQQFLDSFMEKWNQKTTEEKLLTMKEIGYGKDKLLAIELYKLVGREFVQLLTPPKK